MLFSYIKRKKRLNYIKHNKKWFVFPFEKFFSLNALKDAMYSV